MEQKKKSYSWYTVIIYSLIVKCLMTNLVVCDLSKTQVQREKTFSNSSYTLLPALISHYPLAHILIKPDDFFYFLFFWSFWVFLLTPMAA